MNKKVFVSIIAVLLGLITLMVLCEISCAETVEPDLVYTDSLHPVEFALYVHSDGNILTFTPETCGRVTRVKIRTNPPARNITPHGQIGGYITCETSATRGMFSCVVCKDGRCTPVDIYFIVKAVSGNTPTLASAETPINWAHWAGVIGLVVAFLLVAFAIFRILLSYDI